MHGKPRAAQGYIPCPCLYNPTLPWHLSASPCSKAVEARTSDWHSRFLDELGAVKRAFEGIKAEPPLCAALPQHAGRVAMLRGLLRRLERTWDHLTGMAGHVPAVPRAAESAATYEALRMGLQQCISTLNSQVRSASRLFERLVSKHADEWGEVRGNRLSCGLLERAWEQGWSLCLCQQGVAKACHQPVLPFPSPCSGMPACPSTSPPT